MIVFTTLFTLLYFTTCLSETYKPVEYLDLSKYQGRWFQVIKDVSDMSFQGFGTCAVADYSITNSNVSVVNTQTGKDGSIDQIKGYAYYKDGNTGGELTVNLEGTPGNAPYWIIELGPVINDEYQYSIVSDNLQLSLFVLSRNVTSYYNEYDKQVKESLEKYGFTKEYNKPHTMEQTNCDYTKYSI